MPTAKKTSFEPVYRQLKSILDKQKKGFKAGIDGQGGYTLTTGPNEKFGKPVWFGCVRSGKSYVSYHLMGIYLYPELARKIPAPLKKRMQGKSCFNFKAADPSLFAALDRLTLEARKRFEKDGLV